MTDAQRSFAAEFFNATWTLIEKEARTPADDRRMLTLAMGSRALWDDIGGDMELIVGDWQVAHVAALTGHPDLSLDFAAAAYERASDAEVPTWLKASTCEGLARAHAAAGHADERDAWVERAEQLLAQVEDDADRAHIAGQLATVDRS